MNKEASIGSSIADSIAGTGDIAAGQAGYPAPVPASGPGSYSHLADRQLGDAMKPFYDLASQARDAEAQRIGQSIFGKRLMGNPVRSVLTKALANKAYASRIRPFLDSVQRDLSKGRAAVADEPLSPESSIWAREQKERLMSRSAILRQKEIDRYLQRFRTYLAKSGWNISDDGNVSGMTGSVDRSADALEL